jgi:hypothetical protein
MTLFQSLLSAFLGILLLLELQEPQLALATRFETMISLIEKSLQPQKD